MILSYEHFSIYLETSEAKPKFTLSYKKNVYLKEKPVVIALKLSYAHFLDRNSCYKNHEAQILRIQQVSVKLKSLS